MKYGVDTNVLIRYLTYDVEQSPTATLRLESDCSASNPCYLTQVVIVEAIWVLSSVYQKTKDELIEILERIINNHCFEIQDRESVIHAFENYKKRSIGFTDCLIGVLAQKYGYNKTLTFDIRAGKYDDFELI